MTKVLNKLEQTIVNINWSAVAKTALLLMVVASSFYVVAMSQIPAVHEAFHDVRHAMGFPCH